MNKTLRAVIIEDDYTAWSVMSDFLQDEGYEVAIFNSPNEARTEIRPTDVLIVDVRIGMNPSAGVDFIILLKNDPRFNDTKTIFISNFGREKIEEKLMQLDQKFIWIDKPIEMTTLIHAIEGNN